MKKSLLPFNKRSYHLFLKTLRKYYNVKQRLRYLSRSILVKARLEKKLILPENWVLPLNTKTVTGIAFAALLSWFSQPVQAQFPAIVDVETIGNDGVTIIGAVRSVSNAGDVNNDGFDDVIIGDSTDAGKSYVVFGSANFSTDSVDFLGLDGMNGFVINGITAGDNSGFSVSGAGDVNNDGFDDVIIGAPGANSSTGQSYVVFGKSTFASSVNLSSLSATDGFTINGITAGDESGFAVSGAGDLDDDDFDDIIIGAPEVSGEGQGYVVFGGNSFAATLDLNTLNGTNGFAINAIASGDILGESVSDAGDVNNDGFDDVIIGAREADPNGLSKSGQGYVIFGKGTFVDSLDLSSLDGTNGFAINGEATNHRAGIGVGGAGDINNDGFDDVIIGAPIASPNNGASYVVFGKNSFAGSVNLSSLDSTTGLAIIGGRNFARIGTSVSAAGDVNNDGFDDVIIEAPAGDNLSQEYAYVIYGSDDLPATLALDITIPVLGGDTNGFSINGLAVAGAGFPDASVSVGGGGDVNGDGADDVIFASNSPSGRSFVIFGKRQDTPTAPTLTSNPTVVCTEGESITISTSSASPTDTLEAGSQWFLYVDNINTTPIDSNTTGIFTFAGLNTLTTYLVRQEGAAFPGEDASIDISAISFTPTISLTGSTLTTTFGSTFTYEWINCADNAIIDAETDVFYTPTTSGSYAVIATAICSDTSACMMVEITDSMVVDPSDTNTISIDENSFGSAISLYPNPTSGDVLLELGEIKDAVITISDVTGKTISVVESGNQSNIPLPLRNFRHGLYFITIAANNEQKVMKLIKE